MVEEPRAQVAQRVLPDPADEVGLGPAGEPSQDQSAAKISRMSSSSWVVPAAITSSTALPARYGGASVAPVAAITATTAAATRPR